MADVSRVKSLRCPWTMQSLSSIAPIITDARSIKVQSVYAVCFWIAWNTWFHRKGEKKDKSEENKWEVMRSKMKATVLNNCNTIRIHAKCWLAACAVQRVILDPGLSCSVVDRACTWKLGLRIKTDYLSDRGLMNARLKILLARGLSTSRGWDNWNHTYILMIHIVAQCVNAHWSYDVLLGQDWLRKTQCSANLSSQVYLEVW